MLLVRLEPLPVALHGRLPAEDASVNCSKKKQRIATVQVEQRQLWQHLVITHSHYQQE
jgi:hypothetical protein